MPESHRERKRDASGVEMAGLWAPGNAGGRKGGTGWRPTLLAHQGRHARAAGFV